MFVKIYALLLAGLFAFMCGYACGDDLGKWIGVTYIEAGEGASKLYPDIIAGMEAGRRTTVQKAPMRATASMPVSEITLPAMGSEVKYIVALGRDAFSIANASQSGAKAIPAFTLTTPENARRDVPTFSLAVAPEVMFSYLKSVSPGTRRIYTVYSSKQNEWLIRLAKVSAETNGFDLIAIEASDSKAAVKNWREILSKINPETDSVWLPQDSVTVDQDVVVPMAISESWGRNIVVFSSSVSHVTRGVLFGFYPDYFGYGGSICDWIANAIAGNVDRRQIIPLKDVDAAWNTRMADRLGYKLSDGQLKMFKRFYPGR